MNALGIIFSYVDKDNMRELTKVRTLASVPIGGKYRIIDFFLSNFVNSNIFDIMIITKSNYHPLIDHLDSGKEWDLTRKRGGLRVLTPFASPDAKGNEVYSTTIEALANNMNAIKRSLADYVILTRCNIIYNLDFEDLLNRHIEKGADITAVYTNNTDEDMVIPYDSPIFNVEESGRISDVKIYSEERGRRSEDIRSNPNDRRNYEQGCCMGVFVMRKSLLESLVSDSMAYGRLHFYNDVLLRLVSSLNIQGYEYKKYFMGIDSIANYMKANMGLLNIENRNKVFENIVYTKVKDSVPAEYIAGCSVKNSIVSDGCRIEGTIENCVLSRGVRVGKGSVVKNSVVMQNTTIMNNVDLNFVILDKDVIVREDRRISGHETFPVVIEKGSIV
jgi:glucose-1-phosphate adenylyltransferase